LKFIKFDCFVVINENYSDIWSSKCLNAATSFLSLNNVARTFDWMVFLQPNDSKKIETNVRTKLKKGVARIAGNFS